MSNILEIARRDFTRIGHSTIALIVAVGLVVIPALYAWFNIAGSWDPYGNTGNLEIAVANSDEGYESDLIPIRMNIGDSVISALHENDQIKWTFVSEDEAVEGVKSGRYYAAVVIPKDFSANMMSLFSDDAQHSNLIYYENQKMNAIAPRVTSAGSSAVRQQVDETFTQTIGSVGLSLTSGLMDKLSGDDILNYVSNLSKTLDAGIVSLRDAADTTSSFAGVMGSTSALVGSTSTALGNAGGTSDDVRGLLDDASAGLSDVDGALSSATATIDTALTSAASSFDGVSSAVDDAFSAADTQIGDTAADLRSVAGDVQGAIDTMGRLRDDLQSLPDPSGRLSAVITRLDGSIKKQEQLRDRLNQTADTLEGGSSDALASRQEIKDLVASAKGSITQVQDEYASDLQGRAQSLKDSIASIDASATDVADSLDTTVDGLATASGSLAQDLAGVQGVLGSAATDFTTSADKLQQLKDTLDAAVQSGDIQKLRTMIGSDPEGLAKALAAPVELDTHAVYPIKNYGSAMAPFYTCVSLWVGGIVLVAMLKVKLDDADAKTLPNLRPWQVYVGRFCLFAVLGFCQSTLMCLGELFFFGIQCDNPLQYFGAMWLTGFVFVSMIYTLTVSFEEVGKALAVVLLVMQVGGSGGTFPIEMTSNFFQAIYPFLPATHAINAMHDAMAGSFGMDYWVQMGYVASFLIPTLALGLVFRRPIMRFTNWVVEQMEGTHLVF